MRGQGEYTPSVEKAGFALQVGDLTSLLAQSRTEQRRLVRTDQA